VPDADAVSNSDRPFMPARVLLLWGGVLAAALVTIGYLAYRELIHYERVAVRHVPAGAELAVRMDLEQVVLFEPVRKHLLPLVDRLSLADAGGEVAAPPSSRLTRLREHAGLNLGLDLRELVFARMPDGRWLLALGGIFDPQRALAGVEKVLREEEPTVPLHREDRVLMLEGPKLAFTQADDGVLLIGSDAAIVERALPEADEYRRLGLSSEGAAAAVAAPGWLSHFETPGQPSLHSSRGVAARLDFGDPLALTFRVDLTDPAEIPEVQAAFEGWLGAPTAGARFVPQADWGGERAIVARASFEPQASGSVITTTWARSELDRACASLAAWLEARWSRLGQ
jgi:hypothetical protein